MKHICIVTGDTDGIGLEVSLKALLKTDLKKDCKILLWRSQNAETSFLNKEFNLLYKKFEHEIDSQFSQKCMESKKNLIEIVSEQPPSSWVKQASELCLQNKDSMALVTAPLSKTQMNKDGFPFKGHTDLLKKITGKGDLFMGFFGDKFNVILATDHEPLLKIDIKKSLVERCIHQALNFRKYLTHNKEKPIGVLGLNPHAGENGILGSEESTTIEPVLKKYPKDQVRGPLVPDVAFDSKNWSKYSFYLCMYHDQGLIPFKMAHPKKGAHITLGLPFIRTSVDHGTAKDIFGKNEACEDSMVQAIDWALKLLSQK